ncbi:MAG: VOC family protein [Sphingomonas sp.]
MSDKFIWYELLTSDLDAAIDFYSHVVGWTAADHENSASTGFRYAIFSASGRSIGGGMALTDDMRAAGARPGWLGYVGVADVDAKAAQIEQAGGTLHVPPTDIPNVGRFALATDPGGAALYVMTPQPADGTTPQAELAPTAPGLISWHELYASQGDEAAFGYYSGLFGWETFEVMDMGPMGYYRIFGADGVQLGGMMMKPDAMPGSAWGYYINVDGIDAAVERVNARGGQVLMGPHEVPGGSWIIQGMDPQGANFSLVSQTR